MFAARELAMNGVRVAVLNRDIHPGGLAEYGIYPTKYRMKAGLRTQFRQILACDEVDYFGNVTVGQHGDLRLKELRRMGFGAVLIATGAQNSRWLGLPGEELEGVFHASDVVYCYNQLPPYNRHPCNIGSHVIIVGIGNVMADLVTFLIHQKRVDEIITIARRGPGEIKFDRKELEAVACNLDMAAIEAEIARAAPLMRSLGQSPEDSLGIFQAAREKSPPPPSPTILHIRFLLSPVRILPGDDGRMAALEVEQNTLVQQDGQIKARGTGRLSIIPADTIIFAIGDRVDSDLGLPMQGYEFCKEQQPRYPVEGISYEVFDPQTCRPLEGIFLAGWARNASEGVVGVARRDGVNAARAVLQYLSTQPAPRKDSLAVLRQRLTALTHPVVEKNHLALLQAAEEAEARRLGLVEYKYPTNEEMLEAIRLGSG